jgi:hypothetical protein
MNLRATARRKDRVERKLGGAARPHGYTGVTDWRVQQNSRRPRNPRRGLPAFRSLQLQGIFTTELKLTVSSVSLLKFSARPSLVHRFRFVGKPAAERGGARHGPNSQIERKARKADLVGDEGDETRRPSPNMPAVAWAGGRGRAGCQRRDRALERHRCHRLAPGDGAR